MNGQITEQLPVSATLASGVDYYKGDKGDKGDSGEMVKVNGIGAVDLNISLSANDIPLTNTSTVSVRKALNDLDESKQDIIEDLADIRAGAGAGATAYQKPQAGIPRADVNPDVYYNFPVIQVEKIPNTDNAFRATISALNLETGSLISLVFPENCGTASARVRLNGTNCYIRLADMTGTGKVVFAPEEWFKAGQPYLFQYYDRRTPDKPNDIYLMCTTSRAAAADLEGTVAIVNGGTGGATLEEARQNLGIVDTPNSIKVIKAYQDGEDETLFTAECQGLTLETGTLLAIVFDADTGLNTAKIIFNGNGKKVYIRIIDGSGQARVQSAPEGWFKANRPYLFQYDDRGGSNRYIESIIPRLNAADIQGAVAIENGGTGATTAAQARQNLGITQAINSAINSLRNELGLND